jgi:GNAT superfamily N-acetyltransferase
MSLFKDYLYEREGKEIIETDKGFITFKIFKNGECYIQDIFIIPEERHTGLAFKMRDDVINIAKERGCHTLIGSVSIDTESASRNLKILLNDGWTIHAVNGTAIFVHKKLEGTK